MEQLTEALSALALAVLTALATIAMQAVRAYAARMAEEQANLIQQRLGTGAARVAGQIAAEVMGNDQVLAATRDMIEAGVDALQARFPDTAGRLPRETLAGMITGELGKLGQAVGR